MKRKFEHPAPSERELTGPRYWRSLDELSATEGFKAEVAREFPEGSSSMEGVDRRQFFKLMAASFALGGVGLAAGCRRPEEHILAYGKSVETTIPGLPLYFASAMPLRKGSIPILAETHQGRPTKIEGNPSYTPFGGATNAIVQASVLDLYDPDRATTSTIKGVAVTTADIQDLLAGIGKAAAATDGEGLAFLAGQSSSPTRAALVAKLKKKFPKAVWAEYEPAQDEPPVAAAEAAFGKSVKPLYQFAKAKRILSVDADFFHSESGSIQFARDFTKGRRVTKPTDPMNRLYAVESTFTLVGSMADHRLRLASSHMLAFVAALAARIIGGGAYAALSQGLEVDAKWLDACAADLVAHKGESLVVVGSHQPAAVHEIAYRINAALGAIGSTVDFVVIPSDVAADIGALAKAIEAGSVKTLVVLGGNPAYNLPGNFDFAALAKRVPEVVRYGYAIDETSQLAGAHIIAAHYLESWGDARTADGTIVPVQPMILPLFDGLTELEVLSRIIGDLPTDPHTLVYDTITALAGGDAQKSFNQFLHDGLLTGSAYEKVEVSPSSSISTSASSAPVKLSKDNLEVRFTFDAKVDDGRFANNGWLQECPDPITKISWDNAILVSPRLGKELGISPKGWAVQVSRIETAEFEQGKEMAYVGEITVNGRTIKAPLHIQPGLANYTISLPLGYGRTQAGHVGNGVGQNHYPLRTSENPGFVTGAKITVTTERYALANTQEHWSMEGRDIVREANYEGPNSYQENPGFVTTLGLEPETPSVYSNLTTEEFAKLPPEKRAIITAERSTQADRGGSLSKAPTFDGVHQWGMSIDLNTCIGCNACVVACQAENNIPVVGKQQVLAGREMHWIRLDRYYSDGKLSGETFGGDINKEIPEDPQVSLQPVGCQHCELAPCEVVCPVNATVHDEEGLNTMAYNRCIGTRYCANNCPYKVRRFNFFDWNKRRTDEVYLGPLGHSGMPELVKMVKNPDVTVRMRGVMEKCTYCVQRIQQAKIKQKVKAGASSDVTVPDGSVKTACQQVCPVESIVFGNVKDPLSAVSQAKSREQDYALLGYLNIRPRTTYLGKLRNPNPAMPDYADLPLSRVEYNSKNHSAHGHEGGKKEPGAALLSNAKLFGGLS